VPDNAGLLLARQASNGLPPLVRSLAVVMLFESSRF